MALSEHQVNNILVWKEIAVAIAVNTASKQISWYFAIWRPIIIQENSSTSKAQCIVYIIKVDIY